MPDHLQRKSSELPSRAPLDYVEIAPWNDRVIQSDEDLFDWWDMAFFAIAGILIIVIVVGFWFV